MGRALGRRDAVNRVFCPASAGRWLRSRSNFNRSAAALASLLLFEGQIVDFGDDAARLVVKICTRIPNSHPLFFNAGRPNGFR